MRRWTALSTLLSCVLATSAMAQPFKGPRPLAPSETVWHPAATPKGGVAWAVLETSKEVEKTDNNGVVRTTPAFGPAVGSLNGKVVRVSGYMMPLQNGERQSHFVLLAYPPDCPFHLNPAAYQFIEVVLPSAGLSFTNDVITVEGKLRLTGQDGSGVFYKILDGRPL